MAISRAELALMRGIVLSSLGEGAEVYETIRGGEHWFFPADRSNTTHNRTSASIEEMEKRLTQSKRQSKDASLGWVMVRSESGTEIGTGLLIMGLSRLQATKFGYKLKLTSILLFTPDDTYIVPTGYAAKID